MKNLAILLFCIALASCSKVETASIDFLKNSEEKPSISPTPEIISPLAPLKPIAPNIKLNSKQKKYLNKSLPPQMREVLEKAETFEILAEVRGEEKFDGERMTFEPNRIVKITDGRDKKEILEAFYHDAANEDSPAVCYEPHHSIRAVYQGKTVEVEICFGCSRFFAKLGSEKFEGTIVRENRKSETLFDRFVQDKSVAIK